MDFPRPSMSASELFGDLKDKLGFGGGRSDPVSYTHLTLPTPGIYHAFHGVFPSCRFAIEPPLFGSVGKLGRYSCNHECLWRIRCCSKAHHGTSQRVSSHGS